MNNFRFIQNRIDGEGEENWIYNILVKDTHFIFRALKPSSEFTGDQGYVATSFITKDHLLKSDLLLKNNCNYAKNDALVYKDSEENEYVLVYESHLTLEQLKNNATWHDGGICIIYSPTISRLINYPGILTHLFSECWHQNKAHGESLVATEAKSRRSSRATSLIQFSVLKDSANFLEVPMVLTSPKCKELISNIEFKEIPEDKDITSYMIEYSLDHLETIEPEQMLPINVSASFLGEPVNITKTIEAKAISGYIPKTRVKLVDGIGTFNVKALELKSGDNLTFQLLDYGRICSENNIKVN